MRQVFASALATVCLALLLAMTGARAATNYLDNPSFEAQSSGWGQEPPPLCAAEAGGARTGNYSVHCTVSTADTNGWYQFRGPTNGLVFGVYYRVTAWYKYRNFSPSANLLLFFESRDYTTGVYCYHNKTACGSATADCSQGGWIQMSCPSVMLFPEKNYVYGWSLRDGTGEYWIDDVALEVIDTMDVVRSADITAWRQEVYDEPVELIADLTVQRTAFEKGDWLNITAAVVRNEDQAVVLRLTEWTLKRRCENIVASFTFDPRPLAPGFYTLNVTVVNNLFGGRTKMVSTNMHKLAAKRTYKMYVDKDLRLIDNGRPFFPLGLYMESLNDTQIDLLTDSPFNLMIHWAQWKDRIDYIHKRSKGRLRVIDQPIQHMATTSTNATIVAQSVQNVVDHVESIKASPGLFGYYLYDEPSSAQSFINNLRAETLGIREADYDHVVFPVINNRLQMHRYKEMYDVTGVDIYPLQTYDALEAVYIVSYQARSLVMNNRAFWNVPQIFDWNCYLPDETSERPPTEQQLRQMTYQMIVGGANGIIYYEFDCLWKMDKKTPFVQEWAKVKRVAAELLDYSPIILSNEAVHPNYTFPEQWAREVNEGRACGVRFWRHEGRDYVLAVNPYAAKQKTCEFGKPRTATEFYKMTGAAAMTLSDDLITLVMPPMDVVWIASGADPATDSGDGDLSGGAIAGIVIGVLAGVAILAAAAALLGFWFIKKRKASL